MLPLWPKQSVTTEVDEIVGEVQWNGLTSRTVACCSKAYEEFLISSSYYTIRMIRKTYLHGLAM